MIVAATGGRGAWEADGTSLTFAGGFLLVTHEKDVVAKVEELIGRMEQY